MAAFASLTYEQLTVETGRAGARRPPHRQPAAADHPAGDPRGHLQDVRLPVEEITGKNRQRPLVTARQIAMYVFRDLTDLSYPAIAREFGGRDHTTVIHAVEKISAQMKEPPDLRPGHRAHARRSGPTVTDRRLWTTPRGQPVDAPWTRPSDLWTTRRPSPTPSRATVHACGILWMTTGTATPARDLATIVGRPQSTAPTHHSFVR